MNFPLSKIKGGRSCDYSYRGIKVQVVRNYSFNGDYVRSSFYDVPSMAIFASSPKELKRRIDAKLNQLFHNELRKIDYTNRISSRL